MNGQTMKRGSEMKRILILFLLIGFITAAEAFAFRCGDEIVSKGDSVATLMARCGPPDQKDFTTEKYKKHWETFEKWYYNCGSNDFIYKITIINSRIVSIDIVGRGTGNSRW